VVDCLWLSPARDTSLPVACAFRVLRPQFNISGQSYTIDLKNGSGSLTNKAADKADIIITIADDDFVALAAGTLNAQQAFMSGKIKVKGNMGLAMKLNTVMAAYVTMIPASRFLLHVWPCLCARTGVWLCG
jgi:alkyl sulfatase BDS1-like metallo-beta-lactamase superfamily hydrolase